jgi:hypothetical protein
MNITDLAVTVYDTQTEAESIIKTLQHAGFGYFNAGDRAKFFGKFGDFWGG